MYRRALRVVVVSVFFLTLGFNSQLMAQATPAAPPEAPQFTSRTQLVLVPVVVTGKGGAHVSGLGRDAFRIEEQGKPRAVTIFEEVKPEVDGTKPRVVPVLQGRSNFNYENAPSGHMTVVVLDLLNTPYLGQGDGMRRLVEYISKTLPRNEAAAVFGLGVQGLRQLYPPTTDTEALLKALKGVPGPGRAEQAATVSVGQSQEIAQQAAQDYSAFVSTQGTDRREYDYLQASWTTLVAMTQIADAYNTVPGRKTLIWATAGFPWMAASVGISRSTLESKYEETWRDLNSAGFSIYSVDVSDLAGFKGSLISYGSTNRKQQTLRQFAYETGGLPCVGIGIDIEKCFVHAVADSSSYYLLGYYLPSNDMKPGWRKLKVKVEGVHGSDVRARSGFYVSGAAEETAAIRHRKLAEALSSPVEYTGVRFNVREVPAEGKTATAGKSWHAFEVGVLGNSITVDELKGNAVELSVVAVAVGSDGKDHGHLDHQMSAKLQPEMVAKFRKTGLSTVQPLELAPGKYDVRFAVRDNLNGEIGTVGYPLVVSNH